jgi:hypothetical protein
MTPDKDRKEERKAAMTYTLRLPRTFTQDHLERLGHEEGLWEELKYDARTITVRMDKASLQALRDDAAYYCDPDGPDAVDWPALIRSAKRVLELCNAALA